MRRLVVLLFALLLIGRATLCEELNDDLRRLAASGGGEPTAGALTTELRSQKMADASFSTSEAIFKATLKGGPHKAATIGAKMTAAATDPSMSHSHMHAMDAGARRHLAAAEASTFGGDFLNEKMSDAALNTQDAIAKATNRGSISKATAIGAKMTAGAASAGISHTDMHMMDAGARHLLANPVGTDNRAEKMSDAALNTGDAIYKATKGGSINKATAIGTKMTAGAAHAGITHTDMHMMDDWARRRLLVRGGALGDSSGDTSLLRAEKMSDSALSTQEAIFKATNRGSVNRATAIGAMMTAAATDAGVSHNSAHMLDTPKRRLTGEGYRHDIGTLDGALAASAAINKAVTVPTKGSAKFATDRGSELAKIVTSPGDRLRVDYPLRKLAAESKAPRRLLNL